MPIPGDLPLGQNIALGGINMVDMDAFKGNFEGVVVRNNLILGGFATDGKEATQKDGTNANNAVIKYVVFQ
jgi:hypothetical protein